jgi:bifunctional DNA primase/polymerase-like protein
MSAFASIAEYLAEAGLAVLPLGGVDGKTPLVKWARWKHPPVQAFVRTLINNYPDANIGVICGLSGVTVVDVDDPKLLPQIIERFGNTPLRISTPSGGAHLWYSSAAERCRNLRKRMARPVGKQFRRANLSSLHQRIRSQGRTLAKMEIRASRAS